MINNAAYGCKKMTYNVKKHFKTYISWAANVRQRWKISEFLVNIIELDINIVNM